MNRFYHTGCPAEIQSKVKKHSSIPGIHTVIARVCRYWKQSGVFPLSRVARVSAQLSILWGDRGSLSVGLLKSKSRFGFLFRLLWTRGVKGNCCLQGARTLGVEVVRRVSTCIVIIPDRYPINAKGKVRKCGSKELNGHEELQKEPPRACFEISF